MIKKIVGSAIAVVFTICALGMGYPQESDTQAEGAQIVDTEVATVELLENMDATQNETELTIEQGTEAIAEIADGEASIQDSTIPLVESIVEANKRKTALTEDELLLLLKVVSAEARGESQEAQYNVACVILNRMESERFPNTLEEVVTQSGQFSCVASGAINYVPITESVLQAVLNAVDDNTVDPDVLWFRSDYYHSFSNRAYQLGRMFFSRI